MYLNKDPISSPAIQNTQMLVFYVEDNYKTNAVWYLL